MWESVENPDGTTTLYYYYPVITQEVESAYQICMFPSYGPADHSALSPYPQCVSSTLPYCCNGSPSSIPCKTQKSLKSLGQ
jgi:hypothetical protein